MTLRAPTTTMFVLSLVLALVAVIIAFTTIPQVGKYDFWAAILAYVVLAVANLS